MLRVGFFENQQIYQKCDETAHSLFTVRACWWITELDFGILEFIFFRKWNILVEVLFVILLFVFHFANRGELPQKFFKLLRGISFFFGLPLKRAFVSILFQIIKNFPNATIIKLVKKVFFKRELSWLSIIQTLPQFRFSQSDNRVHFCFF